MLEEISGSPLDTETKNPAAAPAAAIHITIKREKKIFLHVDVSFA